MALKAGTKLGPYEILSPLGAGGMGEVYLANDSKLDRKVAIKVLPELMTRDKERVARFEREAKLLASLNHPNIAAIHGFDDSDGTRFLVMEYVEGETLGSHLKNGAVAVEDALDIAKQIAEALEAAHEQGVIHRDLKPANVMITREGTVKVLDFGLAKAMATVDDRTQTEIANSPTITAEFTRVGTILGTAAYMSPEQARGKPLDKRTDIWSFGCVLYECLAGQRPFEGETATDLVAKILERDPDWDNLPANTPPVVKALIQRCFRKDRKERLRDIGEAWVVLNSALSGELSGLALTGYTSSPESSPLRRILSWGLCGLIGIALGLSFSEYWNASEPEVRTPIQMNVEVSPDHPLVAFVGAQFAFSPDGSLLAYVAGSPREQKIYVRRMDQLESTALSGTMGAALPFFSPDGQWIAFFTFSHLKKISVSGGTPVTLCDVELSRGGTWGADGTIVFAPNTGSGLFRVHSAGGEPEELTQREEGKERSHRWPRFTPDGRHVLFTTGTYDTDFNGSSIEVLSLETMQRKVIHRGGSYPQFVPGGYLVFVKEATAFGAQLSSDTWDLLSAPVPIIEGVLFDARNGGAQLAFANNGTMAYRYGTQTTATQSLVLIDRDGTVTPLIPDLRTYASPKFSPDGKQLAMSIVRSDAPIVDLWLYDMTRRTLIRLTFGDSNDIKPIWFPDGERIAFASIRDSDKIDNMYFLRADGSGEVERLLPSDLPQIPHALTPDQKTLIYGEWHGTTKGDIWSFSMNDGAKPEPFLVTPFIESEAALSPNGKWLAYSSGESGHREIYLRPFPKAPGKWQLSTGGGRQPVWSPDGKELFFWDDIEMMVVTIDTEAGTPVADHPTRLFEFPAVGSSFPGMGEYDISPDGERFVVIKDESAGEQPDTSHLRFVLHWFDELDSKVPKGK